MLYHKNTFFTIQFIINKPIKQKVAQWRLFYFPQQFLYFFPDPHVLAPRILLVFIVFIILSVFVGVTRQCTFGIYRIFSIYNIYNIHIPMSNRCH